ncbi:MAG: serine hydrolase domain-containing protein [Moraxellaceae bacterium]|nr:serine hydrolase domain-containing protein [Moraxellaceae bacterium]MDZ4387132.1 serine hydrolase domain-containing protein [Moraxellaceae bacterium]
MKLLSANTSRIVKDIASVTTFYPNVEADADATGVSESDKRKLWACVEDYYKTGVSPAVSICIRRNGHVLFDRAIGHTVGNGPDDHASADKVLATPDTPFCLFSASKAITAMLIHKLAETHQLDLLAPVAHYLPEFGNQGKQYTTIAHVLSHRSGFPSIPANQDLDVFFDTPKVVALLNQAKPSHRSGHHVAYHAITGGYILGELITKVTGKTPREYLQDTVSTPLGLNIFNYGLAPEHRGTEARHYATGFKPALGVDHFIKHLLGGSLDELIDVTNDPRFLDVISPAANIYATANDSCRFFECLLRGGSLDGVQVFKPVTIERAIIEAGKTQFDRSLLAPIRYSHGLMLGANPVGLYGPMTGKAFGHIGFSNVFCWADPARNISVSILTSGKPIVGPHIPALVKLLTAISFYLKQPQ